MLASPRFHLHRVPILLLVGFVGIGSASTPWAKLFGDVVDHVLISKPRLSRRPAHRALAFGDYAEIPGACPATTTCPLVCVANATDCPVACEDGLSLCNDGVCSESCEEWIETPCECDDLSVACARVIDSYDACFERFQEFYDTYAECLEAISEEIPLLSFTEPAFVFCYVWISAVTVLVFLWCLFNQKLFPVPSSTLPLSPAADSSIGGWTQTGYKTHWIGNFVHALVILTFVGIQFLLLLLTIFYYMQQEAITTWAPVFLDEVQALMAFVIVWMIGFPWTLAFKYPATVKSLFLRRCKLEHAMYVAVVAPTKAVEVMSVPGMGEKMAGILWAPFDFFFRLFFSYPHAIPGTVTRICKVENNGTNRSFYHRMRRYVYNTEAVSFAPGIINVGTTIGDFLSQMHGLTSDEVAIRGGLAGPNVIKIKEPTIHGSILKEFSKGFYIYQTFMVWTYGPYWYYFMMIVHTIVRVSCGIVVGVFQFMSDSVLHKLSLVEGNIEVLRDGEFLEIAVTDVVPGDIVVIKPGNAPCDMVVVKAHHILVDESALTGESIPIMKTALDPTLSGVAYNPKLHKSNTISAGTVVIEVGDGQQDLGLVLKTGSFTTKGELLSDVLSYERHKFKFDAEVKLVLFILLLEAIILVALVFYYLQDQWVYAWFYGAYVVGTVFPPLLPSVFVVSVGISANRLQAKRISCTNPEGILVAGKVDAAFFDKTGTLTKNGMDFLSFDSGVESADKALVESAETWIKLGMAVCHTLAVTTTGELVGNQVDTVSFETSKAIMKQENGELLKISYLGEWFTVLKRYEFDTHRATQSVIVQNEGGKMLVFAKGSPEAIRALSNSSAVPASFDATLRKSSRSGTYQIAIAYKEFDLTGASIADVHRDDVEKSLTFAGFVNFQNVMKEDTPAVLRELKDGNMLLAMITGDSVLTGICIARESGMIGQSRNVVIGSKGSNDEIEWTDEEGDVIVQKPICDLLDSSTSNVDLALSGDAWSLLRINDPKYASAIAKHVRVFGRCNPSDKVSVVSTFVESGYITLMCGDGQNDCGALKSAHVGVALSTSEASIVAPFTSLDKVISSVPEVLREGRCALASAFAAYTFYITYGQVESFLQTISAYLAITFTEWCWVFLDGIWSITLAFSLPLSKAARRLSPIRPTASLLGRHTMYSACGLIVWNFSFLVIALLALFSQDWFQCRKWNSEDVSDSLVIGDNYESSVLFLVGGYQVIASAIALNFGYTFRQNWWKNYVFVFFAILWTSFVFVMTIYPSGFSCIWRVNCDNENAVRGVTETEPDSINNPWNTTVMPVAFRWMLVAIMAANVVTLIVWEYCFVNGFLHRRHGGKIDKEEANIVSTTPP